MTDPKYRELKYLLMLYYNISLYVKIPW